MAEESLADMFEAQLSGEPPQTEETPVEEPKKVEEPAPTVEPVKEEPKKDDEAESTGEEKKPTEEPEKPKDPEAPVAPEVEEPAAATPLTKEDVAEVINKLRDDERTSGQVIETATDEVLKAYYPDGLSNTLVTPEGKQLKTPQDVVDASGGTMSTEEASSWLVNEQYKLDTKIAEIKQEARGVAEQTVKFKEGVKDVLTRYEPVFKAYPGVQEKVWKQFSKGVKSDEAKNVILSAPDIREFYDTFLEPYKTAYDYAQKNPGAAPVAPGQEPTATPPAPTPATPSAEDRLDEAGDGGVSPVDDPNDFAQQVVKELSKERR